MSKPKYWDRRYLKNANALPQPRYTVKEELDVYVTSRYSDKLCVDVFRPDAEGRFPALLAFSAYGKSSQSIRIPPQSWGSHIFDHSLEAGDIDYFVKRGFAFVIADPHGVGKSEGEWNGPYCRKDQEDCFDIIEWIAQQPWCDGNVGMSGISYFGFIQPLAAALQPPHLKAIMPIECCDDLYLHTYRGGMITSFYHGLESTVPLKDGVADSVRLYSEKEIRRRITERLQDPDIKYITSYVKVLTCWPYPKNHLWFFDILLHPLDGPFWHERSTYPKFSKIKIPVYLCDPWRQPGRYGQGVFRAFMDPALDVPKKVMVFENWEQTQLPYRIANEEMLRWYSHWFLGIDTGIMKEPPINIYVSGVNRYRWENEWPLARTQWTKFYLKRFGQLDPNPEQDDDIPADPLTHVPPTVTTEIRTLNYKTAPFLHPFEITGPIALYLYASIDATDANVIAKLWDVSASGARVGFPVSVGNLKLSHSTLIQEKSTPWCPVHDHTRVVPVKPGEIKEYAIEMLTTSNVFLPGHHLELEIKTMDPIPSVHFVKMDSMGPLPSSNIINYRIFRDRKYRSHLLLPVIPETDPTLWVQPFNTS